MNKKTILPVVAAVFALGGVGAIASTMGSDTPPQQNQSSSVQGAQDQNSDKNDTTVSDESSADTAVQGAAGSTSQNTGSPAAQSATPQPTATDTPSSSAPTDTSTADQNDNVSDSIPTVQGDSDQLEVTDVVPVPVDSGGPTIEPSPVQNGAVRSPSRSL